MYTCTWPSLHSILVKHTCRHIQKALLGLLSEKPDETTSGFSSSLKHPDVDPNLAEAKCQGSLTCYSLKTRAAVTTDLPCVCYFHSWSVELVFCTF